MIKLISNKIHTLMKMINKIRNKKLQSKKNKNKLLKP